MSHPEIEAGMVSAALELMHSDDRQSLATSVDLLEVYRQPKLKANWIRNLDHNSLVQHVNKSEHSGTSSVVPALRVLFFGAQNKHTVRAHPSTLDWLQKHLAVSGIFLESIINVRRGVTGKLGNACFLRRNERGRVVVIDGFYSFSNGHGGGPGRVWFSHDLLAKSVTYCTANCPDVAKDQIVGCALGRNPLLLMRPCAIDAFIAESYSHEWTRHIAKCRKELVAYEGATTPELPSSTHATKAVESLHRMSQTWHIIYEDLADDEERLEFLLDIRKKYDVLIQSHDGGTTQPHTEESSVLESLNYQISRNRIWKRWVANYNERTKIRINLFFNLASQGDNRTNLEIANLTSEISKETQRDSSSMITIAAVTMFFLPGTFVSAIFSTVFFDYGTDENGRAKFTVSPRWWYVVVFTIPLTIIVFVVWDFWRRRRDSSRGAVVRGS